jgi:protein TonB
MSVPPEREALAATALSSRSTRAGTTAGLAVSIFVHGAMFGLCLLLVSRNRDAATVPQPPIDRPLVYATARPGNPGDVGSGPPVATLAAEVRRPAQPPVPIAAPPETAPPPMPRVDLTVALTHEVPQMSGVSLTGPPGPGGGKGADGAGPGSRPGPGAGDGSSPGPGPGPGRGGGEAAGPWLIQEVRPIYTAAAMRARIQGMVVIRAVIRADGRVGTMQIIRSLDRVHGLDDAALVAARQWIFKPAVANGRPVEVTATLEVEFRLR